MLAIVLVVVGCAGAVATDDTRSETSSVGPTPATTSNVEPSSALATFKDWVERQGFGGGSGLNGLSKAPRFLRDNAGRPGADLDTWATIAVGLQRWLGEHPPTACWADYHAVMAGHVADMASNLLDLQTLARTGTTLPDDRIEALEAAIEAALAIPKPTGCD